MSFFMSLSCHSTPLWKWSKMVTLRPRQPQCVAAGMGLSTELACLGADGFPSLNLTCILRFSLCFCMV